MTIWHIVENLVRCEFYPLPCFFYGMESQQEISVNLEPGKTLVIQCQAIGETDDDGNVRVFFELNGQPRIIKVPNRMVAQAVSKRPKGDPENPLHVISPMPGVISSVSTSVGHRANQGDVLMTIEAMKNGNVNSSRIQCNH